MSIRHRAKNRRAVGAVLAAALSLSLTACGGGDDGSDKKNAKSPSSTAGAPEQPQQPDQGDGGGESEPGKVLATINGSNGFQFTINSAVRDEGGFLTISGVLKNTTGKGLTTPVQWNGTENEVTMTGPSLAGMTLVDKKAKKRYYVLRDTDDYPLTTTGLSMFTSGQSVDFFAQFPSPPAETDTVEVQIPLMPTATIELS
ncbi:hypothetical protein [Streptomyces sp. NBC_00690]|uniref:hypothetical protein n=1 Tax=Streptomyces sp. NBC_00690 TaxID=2975808 RepID=UPI002E2CFD1B|nr:hypothetical protein [Streptomyces sp. NBC_00690]